MKIEDVFGDESMDKITEDHMIKLIDHMLIDARDAMVEQNTDELPLTSVIVSSCSNCDDLHLMGSQIAVEDETLKAMPEDDIFVGYCKRLGRAMVSMGQVPAIVAFMSPVTYYAGNMPQNIDYDDDEAIAEYAKTHIDGVSENSGEAYVICATSVNGIQRVGIQFAKRDRQGFIKPVPGPEEMETRNFGLDDDSVSLTSADSVVWSGITTLYDSARDAVIDKLLGKDVDLDHDDGVEFRGFGDVFSG